MPDCAEKTAAYWVATSSSAVLAGSWLAYGLYLMTTSVTKQSVYMGEITFYAAILLAVTCFSVAATAGAVGYLVVTRRALWRRASLWALGSLALAAWAFWFTRSLIAAAA